MVGITQHAGLRDDAADFRKCTRSVRLDPLSRLLYWRMNWHIEHHMYAGIPCYYLKKLSCEIATDMPAPRTLGGAWREMREVDRRRQLDPTYQFDTPLPRTAGRTPVETVDELAGSIGELLPKGLAH